MYQSHTDAPRSQSFASSLAVTRKRNNGQIEEQMRSQRIARSDPLEQSKKDQTPKFSPYTSGDLRDTPEEFGLALNLLHMMADIFLNFVVKVLIAVGCQTEGQCRVSAQACRDLVQVISTHSRGMQLPGVSRERICSIAKFWSTSMRYRWLNLKMANALPGPGAVVG